MGPDDQDRERLLFFRKTRQDLLKKLGLPPDTSPENFQHLLEERERRKRADAVEMFRMVRKKLLTTMGLPPGTAPSDVQILLEAKRAVSKLSTMATKLEAARKKRT